ncbi:MAG: hypothetical protein AAFO81_06245 [Pseudomonadota bacterium]
MLGLTGCASLRNVADGSATINVGDTVRLTQPGGERRDIEVTALDDQSISGRACKNCDVEQFELSAFDNIQVRKVSGAKTTGLILGLVLLGGIIDSGGPPTLGTVTPPTLDAGTP